MDFNRYKINTMSAIHQFVAGFTHGDAISNEAIVFRNFFRSWGYESRIFSQYEHTLPSLRGEAYDVSKYSYYGRPDDTVLLHLSSGSPVNDAFGQIECRKALLYHNLTPAHYFEKINRSITDLLENGREQARSLAGKADINMAVSRYDAEDLEEMGYSDVKVLPIIMDFKRLEISPDKGLANKLSNGTVNIVFVGRCVPNKKIEDLLKTLHYYNRYIQPDSRLIHVGAWPGAEVYYLSLRRMARELNIEKNVSFLGAIPQEQLNAVYRTADVFLCMSEHEGFCIPLLESMFFEVPILAYRAAAVPETLGESGIIFDKKDHKAVAEMISRIVDDKSLRSAILQAQQKRLAEYRSRDLESELKSYLHSKM